MVNLRDVKSRDEFACYLNISRNSLNYILYNKKVDNLYHTFEIPKKNGGMRQIYAPDPELKYIQSRLAERLYEERENRINKSSHGFEKNRDIYTNARIHTKKRFVYNIDLEGFFESFHFGRVRGYFHKNKNFSLPIEVSTIIAQLSCYKGTLPQGSPCSPIITNFICEILDARILNLCRKYKLSYTRYADDMTFSTDDRNFINNLECFYLELNNEIEKAGFKINQNKTRLQDKYSRQEVTGLVVNQIINVSSDYYKKTRAMANYLYKNGCFTIDDKVGTINQLEGRLAFINQIKWKNNKKFGHNEKPFHLNLTGREREYQKFLFYKYFYSNPKPLIVVEGKTDILYLKSALKKLHFIYPNIISKNLDGTFDFKVTFLNKTSRLGYFLGIFPDGGNGLQNIYHYYKGTNKSINYSKYFTNISGKKAKNSVILILDNEINNESKSKKPVQLFNLSGEKKSALKKHLKINVIDNLFILVTPIDQGQKESEMEDLFDTSVLNRTINGKSFSRKDEFDNKKYFGKHIFSKYIYSDYRNIDFDKFIPMLDMLNQIILEYED